MPSEPFECFYGYRVPDFHALAWEVAPLRIMPDVRAVLFLLAAVGIEKLDRQRADFIEFLWHNQPAPGDAGIRLSVYRGVSWPGAPEKL